MGKLERDLRKQILTLDAKLTENTEYGSMYEIRGKLTGPNGTGLKVVTIWMMDDITYQTKFITLYPDKEA